MPSIVVNQGLQRIGINASQSTEFNSARFFRVLAVDDRAVAFVAGDTQLGNPTNIFDAALDATPTRTGQTIRHIMTIPTGSGNFTIRRVSLHDDTAANVTGTSATLGIGIDGQSLTKTADFTLEITVDVTYTSI